MSFFAQMPLVISYYTQNTPYEEEAKHLQSSCEKFSIPHEIEGVPDQGNWIKNCALKPYFIRKKMQSLETPLLWVDADAVFINPPKFEEFMFAPLAIKRYEGVEDPAFAIHAGTLYVNATQEGKEALDLWCQHCDQIVQKLGTIPPFLDQIGLFFLAKSSPFFIDSIPDCYCKVFDRPLNVKNQEIIIEQRQASRRLNQGEKTRIYITSKAQLNT